MPYAITTYRNPSTGETCPAHCVGDDGDGLPLYNVRDGWEPTVPYGLNEDGLAYPLDVRDGSIADPYGGVWWPHERTESDDALRAAFEAGDGDWHA